MIDQTDERYATLVDELQRLFTFIPIFVSVKCETWKYVALEVFSGTTEEDLKNLAEYLRMSRREISEIRAITDQIREIIFKHGLPVFGIDGVEKYIDRLVGEMSMQEAFPKSAPSWWLYHVDPESRSHR